MSCNLSCNGVCVKKAAGPGCPQLRRGLNNKVRVIQRRAYGLRDEEYLRLKILTCMLPVL